MRRKVPPCSEKKGPGKKKSSLHSQVDETIRYRSDDKFLARQGRKQATATEDFEFHISYLQP